MKKLILLALVIIGFQTAKSQVYIQRYALANKDTVRTQVRMACIEIATSYVDTATNGNKRLCADILVQPTASWFIDLFIYPLAAIAQSATPTDAQVKAGVLSLWNRNALINTRR
jgi:hypothetical protein